MYRTFTDDGYIELVNGVRDYPCECCQGVIAAKTLSVIHAVRISRHTVRNSRYYTYKPHRYHKEYAQRIKGITTKVQKALAKVVLKIMIPKKPLASARKPKQPRSTRDNLSRSTH